MKPKFQNKKRQSLLHRLRQYRKRPTTLRRRIVTAFAIVLTPSILLTIAIAFLSTSNEFDDQSREASQRIANDVSQYVSEQLALQQGWESINPLEGIANYPTSAIVEWDDLSRELDTLQMELDSLEDQRSVLEDERTRIQEEYQEIQASIEQGELDRNEETGDWVDQQLDQNQARFENELAQLEDTLSRLEDTTSNIYDRESRLMEERDGRNGLNGLQGLRMRINVYDEQSVFEWASSSGGERVSFTSRSAIFPDLWLEDEFTVPIYDKETGAQIGTVSVIVTDEWFGLEREQFLGDLVVTLVIGSIAILLVSLLFGTWLARRITAPVTALTHASLAIAEDGNAKHLPVTSQDELGQMSATFNHMVDRLSTQRKLRKRLVSDVSHEINTPLSVIQLEAVGLKDGIRLSSEAADQIIYEVSLLKNLVYDLNWLGETDLGEVRLDKSLQSIKQLLVAEVARWQGQAEVQQIALLMQLSPNLPSVEIDALRVGQALGNLMRNALEHTPVGGNVLVSAEMRPIKQASGDWTVICVKNSGKGIDSAELEHVFERFYRTDNARSRGNRGHGLGLSIARQLVQLHGGHTWAESVVDKSASFFIALPPA